MDARALVESAFAEHAETVVATQALFPRIAEAATLVDRTLRAGGKLLFCGNGGSAADAQHLAAEFVGRFRRDRRALPALALHAETSSLTAIANDYGFERVFARQVEAFGQPGDLLIAITTSGESPNAVAAARAARERGLRVLGLTGAKGGALQPHCDLCLCVPGPHTARVQEVHILIGHILCEVAEAGLG